MKTFITLFLIAITFSSFAGNGDAAQSSFGKNFLPIWENSTQNAIEVAEAMPEELYGFKPNDSSKTFAEQLIHLSSSSKNLSQSFILGKRGGGDTPDASAMSKAEIIAFMKDNFAVVTENISNMTEDQANETITVFGGKQVARYIGVMFIQDHLANHRAKANLYIRINDIKPPAYKFF